MKTLTTNFDINNLPEYELKPIKIEYMGKKISTASYCDVPKEILDAIREDFYKKPDYKEVKKNFHEILKGKNNFQKIEKYYIRELMYDTVLDSANWSVNESMANDELLGCMFARQQKMEKLFTEEDGITKRLETVIRIMNGSIGTKPPNYPIESVRRVLGEFKLPNNNYYDFSCGWGARLTGALASGFNYYGTDPNFKLTEKLNELAEDFTKECDLASEYKIFTQGSETFIPELEDKIGIAFSSPPYFIVEEYRTGQQSTKDRNYEQWLNDYWRETVRNISRYLKEDGVFLLNIKNMKKWALLDDTKRIAQEEGFKYHYSLELDVIKRPTLSEEQTNNEEIMVFTKGDKPELKVPELDVW